MEFTLPCHSVRVRVRLCGTVAQNCLENCCCVYYETFVEFAFRFFQQILGKEFKPSLEQVNSNRKRKREEKRGEGVR